MAAVRFKKKQFSFGRHGMVVFGMLEQCRMASPIAVPPGSRSTAALIPHFARRAAGRFTCVDFPQPSEPSNVISGMATILRQRGVIVEHPIFALFGLRQRGKFDP